MTLPTLFADPLVTYWQQIVIAAVITAFWLWLGCSVASGEPRALEPDEPHLDDW